MTGNPTRTHLITRWIEGDPRLYGCFFAALSVATVVPLWIGAVLPFQDFAGNMTYGVLIDGASVEGSRYAEVYELGGAGLPNGLFLYLWSVLGPLLGWAAAGKLLLSICAVALPWSVDRLLVAAGRDRRFALLAFPLFYSSSMLMGFVSYVSALPIMFYALACAYRYREVPSRARGVGLAALACACFLAHAQAYLILGLLVLVFLAVMARSWREAIGLAAPFSVSLLLFAPWFWDQFIVPLDGAVLGGVGYRPEYQSPDKLLSRLGEYILGRWHGDFDDWTLFGILGVYLCGLLDRRSDQLPHTGRARYGLEIMAAAVFLAYLFVVPEHSGVQAYIGSRLVAVVALLALGFLAMPAARWLHGPMMVVMLVLGISFSVHVANKVATFNAREAGGDLLALLDTLPERSHLAWFTPYGQSSVMTNQPHEHLYGYHFALNDGLAHSHFHSYTGRHVSWSEGHTVPAQGWDVKAFLKEPKACWYEYVLLRTRHRPQWGRLSKRVTYVGDSNHYSLWKIERDRIPACVTKDEARGRVARDGEGDDSLRPLPSRLTPKVTRTRGLDARGALRLDGKARRQNPKRVRSGPRSKEEPPRRVEPPGGAGASSPKRGSKAATTKGGGARSERRLPPAVRVPKAATLAPRVFMDLPEVDGPPQ